MANITPLRYPGGKGRLYSFINHIIETNNLQGGMYAEGYAGGAGIALLLLKNNRVSEVIINDLDRSIYAFWHSILNYPKEFCRRIEHTPISISQWLIETEVQKRKADADLFELGFSTFYLNRTNRSGIITAGLIGGKKQDGEWKMDARFNKPELIQRIKEISKIKSRIHICNWDACYFINEIAYYLPNRSLSYFDPPYFVKGKTKLYVNYYREHDHEKVADNIKNLENNWIVTYDSVKGIKDLYADHRQIDYALSYAANEHIQGKEVAIFSDSLEIPKKAHLTKTLNVA